MTNKPHSDNTQFWKGLGAALEIKDLSAYYGKKTIFQKLNFKLSSGAAAAIVGPSGCGKSTLLHILAGLSNNYQGEFIFSPPQARKSLMLQQYGLFPWKSALENIELPFKLRGLSKAIRLEKSLGILEELGLKEHLNNLPKEMSGGQQQRLALGRALAAEPEFLLLDEPFSSLDAIKREKLQNLLAGLHQKYKLSYILATHSIEEASFLGEKILVMSNEAIGFLAELNNPCFGQDDFRSSVNYFNMQKILRQTLTEARGEKLRKQQIYFPAEPSSNHQNCAETRSLQGKKGDEE